MDDVRVALVTLSRSVAAAMEDFATAIEAGEARPEAEARPAPEPVTVTGHRQRQIVGLPDMGTTRGMTTGEVSRLIQYDQPNVYNTMHELQRAGVVERADEGDRPQRWRLVSRYRATGG